jgi:hypothetical protein
MKFKMLFYGLWYRVVWYIITTISAEPTAFIFM